MNILFVCTGNTCRSPMAEGYLRDKNIDGLKITSRGLAADASPASENAVKAMHEIGIDISNHISAQLFIEDTENADKIICLSRSHFDILSQAGTIKSKLVLLGDGISDPYGGSIETYRKCRDEIIFAIDCLLADGIFSGFSIVPLEQRHIASVAKLENVCFSDPWSAEGLLESFKNGTHFFVAENDTHIMGYIGISAVVDEGYITNVAVFPHYRKMGVATALLNRVFRLANEKRLAFVSLEVRVSNSEAISLYEKLGFQTEGRRRDFYHNPREDALIMTRRFDYTNEITRD